MVPSLHTLRVPDLHAVPDSACIATTLPRARPQVSSNTRPSLQKIYMPESPAAAQTMQAHPGASLLDRLPCAVFPFIISKQLRAPTALADMMPCLSRHPRITQALERRMSIADRTRAAAKMTCTASPRNLGRRQSSLHD
jgi:hypothetical protein